MAAPKTEVLVTVGGSERSRYLFSPGDYVIGRNLDCAVRVEAVQVSRQHAKLILDYDNAFIEDLGSSNGTRVNGKPVHGRTRLRPNQKVQCGAATIELRRLRRDASELSLSPATAFVGQALPPAMLREKKYDIGNIVAVGGMGEVLDAKEAALERRVAMKTMLGPASKDELQRFINEARITGQLEHPNIVPVHELSVDEYDQVFYTMKLVKGATLKAVIERLANGEAAAVKQYPLATLLTAFQKVCDAVAFAHSKKVLHRDLKPENIMLGEYGEVLVMDWGLAKILDPARAAEGAIYEETERSRVCVANDSSDTGSMTMEGTILGTPKYMAPEQARGESDTLTTRSDIYSLGGILYQLLTLHPAVEGRDAEEVLARVSRADFKPPLAASQGGKRLPHLPRGRVPASLDAVVMKAMSLEPAARYQSVPELQAEIQAYQNGFATEAEEAGVARQIILLVKRNKALSGLAAAAVVIISVIVAVAFQQVGRERDEAIVERNRAAFQKQRAETALVKTERSLLMIGDAHEAASRLVSDVLANLSTSLKSATPDVALENARQTVREYFDDIEPTKTDEDSLHTRSVVLNTRGYFALSQGDFSGAEKFFAESLALRRTLAQNRPENPLWQHNLGVSLDNLGDVHVRKAQALRGKQQDSAPEYATALQNYRESFAIIRPLADRADASPVWRHDLAIGHFKVADVILAGGDRESALAELRKGFEVARKVAESDPEYAKWQATLGLYCLKTGQILLTFGKDEEAMEILKKGRGVFNALRDRKRLTATYARFLEGIEAELKDAGL